MVAGKLKVTRKGWVPEEKPETFKVGLPYFIGTEQGRAVGIYTGQSGSKAALSLAFPDAEGKYHNGGTEVLVEPEALTEAVGIGIAAGPVILKAWNAELVLEAKTVAVREGDPNTGPIVDYRDVTIEGYLSTFVGTTPSDRDGDYVEPTAFDKTLTRFRENPVMLIDHDRRTSSLAGSFTFIGTTDKGLAVRGRVSNAPDMKSIRFKVAEGHLKTLSMGGLFRYRDDGRGIYEVDLWEGSIVTVPANPDALFQVRSLTVVDAAKACKYLSVRTKTA